MLCPEVWNFKPPRHHCSTERKNYKKISTPSVIRTHYFNHSVSLVLPDTANVSDSLHNCISEDNDYYRVNALRPVDLLNKEFIEAFVKRGELNLLTIGNKIDLHNSIGITPSGYLILSLITEDFQKLGLEGESSFFDRKTHTRCVVRINLKADAFNPGKKNYEHARTCLEKRLDKKFNVIVAWDPPEENLCPSSIAAWFHKRGYDVSLCHQQFFRKTEYSLKIPTITDGYDSEKFFEWLGVFSISGNLTGSKENYVNTYECPNPSIEIGQVQYLQWTGFFTRKQLEKIYNSMKEYIQIKGNLWCSLHVQGFSDSPVSWDLKEHTFYTDGDNSYTILFQPNDEFIIRKSISSNNKCRIFQ